jgi:DNA-binding PadR family transcriptional regulator
MGKSSLGELEIIVLLAILQVGTGAYARNIADEMQARAGRKVTRGALYVTLERLVDKGHLKSRMGDTAAGRGGRARRYYEVTGHGLRAVRDARRAMRSMWDGLGAVIEEA